MSEEHKQQARVPPRWFVRLAWSTGAYTALQEAESDCGDRGAIVGAPCV